MVKIVSKDYPDIIGKIEELLNENKLAWKIKNH